MPEAYAEDGPELDDGFGTEDTKDEDGDEDIEGEESGDENSMEGLNPEGFAGPKEKVVKQRDLSADNQPRDERTDEHSQSSINHSAPTSTLPNRDSSAPVRKVKRLDLSAYLGPRERWYS